MSLLAPSAAAAEAIEFSAPPPNLLYQLQKQNRSRPWLRVTTDASRLDLRVGRIDELGLDGVAPRAHGGTAPERIAWRSIARIDAVETRALRGMITGLLVGGSAGAALGNAIGAGIRSRRTVTNPYDGSSYEVSDGHGGAGAMLGLAALGGLGAWAGSRLGARMVHERPWYVAAPVVPAASASPADSSAAAAPSSRAATESSATATSRASPDLSRSRGVLRACALIDTDDLLRVRGDFGQFQGFAAVIGPQGLDGLRSDPNRPREYRAAEPAGVVTWDRIDYVDKRGSSVARGAAVGGISLGLLGGLAAAAFVAAWGAEQGEALQAGIEGGAITGSIGAVLGAAIGAAIPAWHKAYDGP